MPWDMTKCVNGVPPGFTNAQAVNLVTNANFNNSVFVQTHATDATRSAFTYVPFGGMTVCVVGHIHIDPATGAFVVPGNSYIPGWSGWQMQTPAGQCAVIDALPDQGVFPGVNRYPH